MSEPGRRGTTGTAAAPVPAGANGRVPAGGSAGRSLPVPHPPDQGGHFGPWGGRFVPEVLMAALDELAAAFEEATAAADFQAELDGLRRTYAGRPTPSARWSTRRCAARRRARRRRSCSTSAATATSTSRPMRTT